MPLTTLETLLKAAREEARRHGEAADPERPCPCALCEAVASAMAVTDAEVERAAEAWWNVTAHIRWSDIPEAWRPGYLAGARTALEAFVRGRP